MLGAAGKTTRCHVTYEGRIDGYAIIAEVARSRDGPKTLLEAANLKTKVLMVLSDDLSKMQVMENPQGLTPIFYTLTSRVNKLTA